MKRAHLRYIAPITISLLIPFGLYASTQFTGPSQSPTGGNTPGVIWDMSTGGTQSATINISGTATVNNNQSVTGDVYLSNGKALKIQDAASTSYNIGNWYGGTSKPFTLSLYGDLVLRSFAPGSAGARGRVDAQEYCINGANCITAWPSGGGGGVTQLVAGTGVSLSPSGGTGVVTVNATNNGTLTGITAGTGITVTGSAPSPTINATDLYVNTTGDTMTGQLTLNWPGYRALTVNGGNGGGGAIYGNNTMASGYGGEFYGAYGVYATTPMTASGYYAGYFDGYAGGVNAIGHNAGGVGVIGQNTGSGSIGVKGYAINGYGGLFQDSTYYSYVGGQGYSLYSNGYLYNAGNASIGGTLGVTGNLTASSNICLGGVCKNAWPAAGGITTVAANSPVSVSGGSGPTATLSLAHPSTSDPSDYIWVSYCSALSGATCIGRGWTTKSYPPVPAPAGSDQQIQFNNAGTLAGTSKMTWNGLNNTMTLGGSLNLNSGIASGAALFVNGAEALWYNGTYFSYGYGGTANYFADNVGVGISSPGYKLDVASRMRVSDGSGTAGIWLSSGTTDQILIGNAVAGAQAEASRKFGIWTGSAWRYTFDGSNNAYKPSGTTWTNSSDARLKDRIKPYEYGLNEISKLNTVRFHYKEGNALGIESKDEHIGMIAQQVKDIIPEAISKDEKGYYTLDADPILWAEVNAIKQLKTENDALKAKTDALEKRLNELEAKLGT